VNEPDRPVVDASVLDELRTSVEGDTGFVRDLIEAYVTDSAGHVDAIEAALAAGDAATLVRPAHTLKSSSATLGATPLAATARTIEMAARADELGADEVRAAAPTIRGQWEATVAALRAWSGASTDR
jgi:HPt (histidine-containing phosphotransfer) domain-containing protein